MPRTSTSPLAAPSGSPAKPGGAYQLEDFIRRAKEVQVDIQETSRTDDENWTFLEAHRAKKAVKKEKEAVRLAEQKEKEEILEGWVIIGKTGAEKKKEKEMQGSRR